MASEMQKKLASIYAENQTLPRPLNKKQMVRKAGYSESFSTVPSLAFNSKGFKEELAKYIPDDKLIVSINRGLNAKKRHYYRDENNKLKWVEHDDFNSQSKYVDIINKIQGNYENHVTHNVHVLNQFLENREY